MRGRVRKSCFGLVLAAALSVPAAASAEPTQGEILFRDGKAAMDRQDYETACTKFKQSYELEHVVNSLLSLANCEEKRNHLARALELWEEGTREAKDDDTRTLAIDRGSKLRPRVPKIIVHVAAAGLANVAVKVDGKPAVVDRETPVDPGDHVVQATADGVPPEDTTQHATEGATTHVTVLSTVVRAQPKPIGDPGAPLRIAGFVTGGVGVAGIVVFGATGIAVLTDKNCGDFVCTKAQRPQGTLVANAVGLVVGIAGLGAGATLLIVAHEKSKAAAKPAASVTFAPIANGAMLGGAVPF
jgi:hypothetical protein